MEQRVRLSRAGVANTQTKANSQSNKQVRWEEMKG